MRLARTLMTAAVALALGAAAAIAADDKKASDPGFNALDKNNDGSLTRAEYLATMTKKDLKTAKQKVGNAIERNKDRDAGTGSTKP